MAVAGVVGDDSGGRRLAGRQDCGARRCRSCGRGQEDAADRESGVGGQEEAVLAAGKSDVSDTKSKCTDEAVEKKSDKKKTPDQHQAQVQTHTGKTARLHEGYGASR